MIKPSNRLLYKACDELCFLSKNLYNAVLYIQRQNYQECKSYITDRNMRKVLRSQKNPDYYALPSSPADYVVKQLDEAYKSAFKLLKLKNKGEYKGKIKFPKYKDKVNGRNVTTFYKDRLRKRTYGKTGLIHLSKTNIKFKSNIPFEQIQEVKVIPKNGYYEFQVIYIVKEEKQLESNNCAAIDLGLNNLATIVTNISSPIIINGKPLKSINHHWNKRKAKLQSKLPKGVRTSKQIKQITNKRNRRINNYLHQTSRALVNELRKLSISKVVIGSNKGWKENISLGKRNNQNFVQTPYNRFIEMLTYKCKLVGIEVITAEESYTSKCSFLDNETIEKHDTYVGKRIKRGLFKSSKGILINADVNGAYNIMKKHLGITVEQLDSVQVFSIPKVLKF
nr:MAG TPA: endonuclease [Caudoviricetes sp.]DAU13332.1 MAG TPA: endonuclease [Caudoviricetes sp.]